MEAMPTYKLGQLEVAIKSATKENKIALLFDQSGMVSTFFTYKGKVIEAQKLKLAETIQQKGPEAANEEIRRVLVFGMKSGDTCVVFCDKLQPDFVNSWNMDNCLPKELWDPAAW